MVGFFYIIIEEGTSLRCSVKSLRHCLPGHNTLHCLKERSPDDKARYRGLAIAREHFEKTHTVEAKYAPKFTVSINPSDNLFKMVVKVAPKAQ